MQPSDSWESCERLLAQAGRGDELLHKEMRTAAHLASECSSASPTGLGAAVDGTVFGGGLRAGEVIEVYGPAGSGKTQLGLTVTAHTAGAGGNVLFVTTKDRPADLASRLRGMLAARDGPSNERLEAALRATQIVCAPDFPAFVRVVAAAGQEGSPQLLVLDGLSGLLAPFVTANGWAHRWRLGWSCRALRRLSACCGMRVLLLSHTAGVPRNGRGPWASDKGRSQPALGQLWAACTMTRLELEAAEEHAPRDEGRALALTLRHSVREPSGAAVALVLDSAGVHG